MPRSWLQHGGSPWSWWALSSPPPQEAITAPLLRGGPGMGPLGQLIHIPLALGARGSRPCLAAPAVPAGPCGSSQTVLAPLANRAHQVALGDRVALVDPGRKGWDDG